MLSVLVRVLHFNSIKVRLKLVSVDTTTIIHSFQFHKGTIKTLHLLLVHSLHFPFQFHKGTIKTIIFSFSLHSSSDFNSIKVRLKLSSNDSCSCSAIFQFHKGTIKTSILATCLSPETYFNSIKVRLKRQLRLHIRQTLLFQFHKGTIKTNNQGNINVDFNYFNSIKVRLKLGEYGSNSLRPHISIP